MPSVPKGSMSRAPLKARPFGRLAAALIAALWPWRGKLWPTAREWPPLTSGSGIMGLAQYRCTSFQFVPHPEAIAVNDKDVGMVDQTVYYGSGNHLVA